MQFYLKTDIFPSHTLVLYLLPLAAFLQDARGVVDGSVVLADGQVGALMLIHLDHQVVVLQLRLLQVFVLGKKRMLKVKSNWKKVCTRRKYKNLFNETFPHLKNVLSFSGK